MHHALEHATMALVCYGRNSRDIRGVLVGRRRPTTPRIVSVSCIQFNPDAKRRVVLRRLLQRMKKSKTINGVEINIQPADMRLFASCSFIEADIRAERYDALRVCYSPVHLSPTVQPGFRRMSRILCDQ